MMCQSCCAPRNVRMLYIQMKILSSWGDVLRAEAKDEVERAK